MVCKCVQEAVSMLRNPQPTMWSHGSLVQLVWFGSEAAWWQFSYIIKPDVWIWNCIVNCLCLMVILIFLLCLFCVGITKGNWVLSGVWFMENPLELALMSLQGNTSHTPLCHLISYVYIVLVKFHCGWSHLYSRFSSDPLNLTTSLSLINRFLPFSHPLLPNTGRSINN